MTYVPEVHWGDGSDGNITIGQDTDLAGVAKQYNNLTINAGVKLYDSTGVLRIKVRGQLILNGNIDQTGLGGSGGAGGRAATYYKNDDYNNDAVAGQPGTGTYGIDGVGAGGNPTSTATGATGGAGAGPGTTTQIPCPELNTFLTSLNVFTESTITAPTVPFGLGGGGGGSGGATSYSNYTYGGGDGGAGGDGGGVAIVYAKSITGSGSIIANGTTGAAGESTASYYPEPGHSGGGGGGGTGGLVAVYSRYIDSNVTIDAAGGAGGAGGERICTDGDYVVGTASTGDTGAQGIVIQELWD